MQLLGNKIKNNPRIEIIDATIKEIIDVYLKEKCVRNGIKLPNHHLFKDSIDELCVCMHYIILIILWSKGKSCNQAVTLIDDTVFDPLQL